MANQHTDHSTTTAGHSAEHSTASGAVHGAVTAVEGVVKDAAHAAQAHADHAEGHAHDAAHGHGPDLGRYISHPPEPPQLLQIWYKMEQKTLIKEYVAANPDKPEPGIVENWLEKGPDGEWKAIPGEKPTVAQLLHIGPLEKPLPIVNYAPWENHAFLALAIVVLCGSCVALTANVRRDFRQALRAPTRAQAFIEWVVESFDGFCKGVLGEVEGRRYMPYIATLFSLILVSNLMGLIPGLKPPTSSLVITLSLALCTFIVVQGTAWFKLGFLNYVYHLAGQPKDAIGWGLSPLFLTLEIISDFLAKPMSLALRLFGNILGKDILFGAFMGMGIALVGAINHDLGEYVGIPLTIPFYALGLLLSTIQALVFSLLSMIYIMMVLPHDHHGHDDHGHGAEHGHDDHHAEEAHHGHSRAKSPVHEAVPG